jgi:hypothetical protein
MASTLSLTAMTAGQQEGLLRAWGFVPDPKANNVGGHLTMRRGDAKVQIRHPGRGRNKRATPIAMKKAAEIVGVPMQVFLNGPTRVKASEPFFSHVVGENGGSPTLGLVNAVETQDNIRRRRFEEERRAQRFEEEQRAREAEEEQARQKAQIHQEALAIRAEIDREANAVVDDGIPSEDSKPSGGASLVDRVLRWMKNHPEQEVVPSVVAQGLGMEVKPVSSTLLGAAKGSKYPIERVRRGVYAYRLPGSGSITHRLATAGEVADAFGVSTSAVRWWARKGLVPYDLTPGGHRRFNLLEVQEAFVDRDMDDDEAQGRRPPEVRGLVVVEPEPEPTPEPEPEPTPEPVRSAVELVYTIDNDTLLVKGPDGGLFIARRLPL